MKGEIMVGHIDRIFKHGMFLKSGPFDSIFMAEKSMSDYKYIGGENLMFMNEHSKLEKDTIVRFKVLGFRWMEADRKFQLLATIAGDFELIPQVNCGSDVHCLLDCWWMGGCYVLELTLQYVICSIVPRHGRCLLRGNVGYRCQCHLAPRFNKSVGVL
ncbi:hypothetical protein HU200_020523 [Digitaria exilis]|uniref:Uncharacterized protein n=1 Tax=Digitaria exilis TaxID=1010633 RepID=A0A835KHD1_9POAL|nr:hypothetical protein HU200_020523 [Digitaria exilis]